MKIVCKLFDIGVINKVMNQKCKRFVFMKGTG